MPEFRRVMYERIFVDTSLSHDLAAFHGTGGDLCLEPVGERQIPGSYRRAADDVQKLITLRVPV